MSALTQAQARKKWCVHARLGAGEGLPAFNAFGNAYMKCLGAGCMAWRWKGWRVEFDMIASNPPPEARRSERMGFCGLAGAVGGSVVDDSAHATPATPDL